MARSKSIAAAVECILRYYERPSTAGSRTVTLNMNAQRKAIEEGRGDS